MLTGDDGQPHNGAPAPTPTYAWLRDGAPITTLEHLGMAGVSIPNFVRRRIQAEIDQQLALAHDLPVIIETFELREGQVVASGIIR